MNAENWGLWGTRVHRPSHRHGPEGTSVSYGPRSQRQPFELTQHQELSHTQTQWLLVHSDKSKS